MLKMLKKYLGIVELDERVERIESLYARLLLAAGEKNQVVKESQRYEEIERSRKRRSKGL